MPLLDVPDLADTPCEDFGLSAAIVLSEDELTSLLRALGTEEKDIHGTTRRVKKQAVNGIVMGVSERFGVDYVGENEERRKRLVEAFQPTALKGTAAGLLHVDVELTMFEERDKPQENLKDDELVTRFWKWVQARAGGLEISVRGWMSFDSKSEECIIGLPLRAPADLGVFNSIPGLILTKREGEGSDARILYEVLVRQDEDELTARVNFVGLADGMPQMLKRLLAQAIEVAHFAVHKKPEGVSSP